jgi:hypothetical protein
MKSVSDNFLLEGFLLQNKIVSFLMQDICICIYFGHSFLWNNLELTPLTCFVVLGRE